MPGRPREFDKDQALSAAVDLFWERGYESASISMLLDEMGINRQSAYTAFGDKRELFLQALRAYIARVGDAFSKTLSSSDASPLERVRQFLRQIGEICVGGSGRGCLITNTIVELAPHDAEVRQLTSTALAGLQRMLAGSLREAKQKGEISAAADPQRLARFLMVVMQGALVLSKTDVPAAIRDAIEIAEQTLENA